MARRKKLTELNEGDLLAMLDEKKDELMNLKFQRATGQLDNMNLLKQTRRDVARVHTELRVREIELAEQPLEPAVASEAAPTEIPAETEAEPAEVVAPAASKRKLRVKGGGHG